MGVSLVLALLMQHGFVRCHAAHNGIWRAQTVDTAESQWQCELTMLASVIFSGQSARGFIAFARPFACVRLLVTSHVGENMLMC